MAYHPGHVSGQLDLVLERVQPYGHGLSLRGLGLLDKTTTPQTFPRRGAFRDAFIGSIRLSPAARMD
jgi:hypothetical protein